MEEATQIIFLDFPRHICLFRVVKRYFTYRGKSRESISNGCEEKIDREFLWWIIHEGRNKVHKERYHNVFQKSSSKTSRQERRVGFSQAYIRELFRKSTGYSLAYYVKMRKIKRSAMELVNTDKTILEIACLYGFSNPETYTRSFRKITGMTPSEFRRQRLMAGKQELFPGVFSIEILREKEKRNF